MRRARQKGLLSRGSGLSAAIVSLGPDSPTEGMHGISTRIVAVCLALIQAYLAWASGAPGSRGARAGRAWRAAASTAMFECQVNNTHTDWIRTGSLYGLANIAASPAQDSAWWTQEIIVQGRTVTVLIDGKKLLQYTEPATAQAGTDFGRKLSEGTFALQAHDPNSVVRYKNVRVKRLD
jgi:hypothetical protein